MKVLILQTTFADGRLVKARSIEELSAVDSALLIELGKAVPADMVEDLAMIAEPVKRKGRKRGAH